jgi:hypothetical protein
MELDLSYLADKWDSAVVARRESLRFTGGTVSPGYLANLDSQGLGPEGRFKIGRNVVYPVKNFIQWLEDRAEACKKKGGGHGN